MIRRFAVAVAVAALVLPGAALAKKAPPRYKVGQKCSMAKEKTYNAAKFMCMNGKLKKK